MSDESTSRDYQSISDMPQIYPESWSKFFVVLTGKTNDTHGDFVKIIKNNGHTEVTTPEECDYCLLFCPITSRVGTDVGLSLRHIPENKPTILVVMYHTFDRNHHVLDSRRLTDDPRVHLKVNCLFHEQKLLSCSCNDIAQFEIRRFLGFPQNSWSIISCIRNHPVIFGLGLLGVLSVIALVIIIVELK
ncbi:uncharacterized protein si:ch211-245h14.1 isoform X3 [Hippoglossus stenolepis]|uniref:uncharacterized protein si:ch211-245h14.1 isoform X3 n=1 Tax=Hippoglossus stenolepis TaxID=195615 RepID=UPI001FAE8DBE|nr:uncharacterized protein si:ch211-245h14.1 isoform X3 [Hippoglossus stenolepis]